MAKGTRTNTLNLAGFIISSNVVIYLSFHNLNIILKLEALKAFGSFTTVSCFGQRYFAKLFSFAPAQLLYAQIKKEKLPILKNLKNIRTNRLLKRLMVDPCKDLRWTFFIMKRLKLDPWKDNSSNLTRKLECVIIVNIVPPARLLKSFH